jgi:hypothetical protein
MTTVEQSVVRRLLERLPGGRLADALLESVLRAPQRSLALARRLLPSRKR